MVEVEVAAAVTKATGEGAAICPLIPGKDHVSVTFETSWYGARPWPCGLWCQTVFLSV